MSETSEPGDNIPTFPNSQGTNPTRRQNSACDACRLRKVKCFRDPPGDDKCVHCKVKKLECTKYYVTLASSHIKSRNTKRKTTEAPTPTRQTRQEQYDFEIGGLVQVRRTEKGDTWTQTPHRIHQIILKPVAVILDDDNNAAISIDLIRPYISPEEENSIQTGIGGSNSNGNGHHHQDGTGGGGHDELENNRYGMEADKGPSQDGYAYSNQQHPQSWGWEGAQ